MRGLTAELNGADIVVKAFANLSGLGSTLQRERRLRDKDLLRAFAAGFSSRKAFFDFVDVGPGKERADLKVRGEFRLNKFSFPTFKTNSHVRVVESIKFYLESFQCKHLVLACGHDGGYAPWLGQFVGDKCAAERMILVEGNPFPIKMRNLGLRTVRLDSVFNNAPQSAVFAGPAWGQISTSVQKPIAGHDNNPRRQNTTGPVELGGLVRLNPKAQSDRLGPVLTGRDGRRIDKALHVDKEIADRIRRGQLCHYFYLRGKCVTNCQQNHLHRALTNEEFDALWSQARQGRCSLSRKVDREGGDDCSDAMCIYGHGSVADRMA